MPEENWLTDCVFTVDDFFTTKECEQYIEMSEDIGYEAALVSSSEGNVLRTDIRNNQRVMFKNDEIASFLWERAVDFLPTEYEGRSAIGINELMRFYRYDPGQRFNWHQDFPYERENGERGYLTLMVYLNDGFEGGQTSFDDSCSEDSFDPFSVAPRRGMALFFEHSTYHIGEMVMSGRKYVLRTDVMYASGDDIDGEGEEDGDDLDVDDRW